MRAFLGPAVLMAALTGARVSHPHPATDAPSASQAPATEAQQTDADLVGELLRGDEHADDLAWLYSNADEYTPTDIAGTPIPAPELPGPGRGSPRTWNPSWRKFDTGNYVLTGVGFGVSGLSSVIPPAPGRWQGRNTLDEWGREHL